MYVYGYIYICIYTNVDVCKYSGGRGGGGKWNNRSVRCDTRASGPDTCAKAGRAPVLARAEVLTPVSGLAPFELINRWGSQLRGFGAQAGVFAALVA